MKHWLLACVLLLAACSPQSQEFVAAPDAPARLEADSYYPVGEVKLPLRSWVPKGKPKAVVVALHGMNDYSKAFEIPGEYLKKRRIAVYAYDQRGFGKSPMIGIWGGEDNFIHDLRQFVLLMRQKHPGVPVCIMGESMGGAIVVNALASGDFPPVDGVVLVAPALWGGETLPWVYRDSLWLMAHLLPFRELTGEEVRILATDNIPLLKEMVKDPFVIKKTRVDAIYGLVALMDNAYANVERLPDVPVLMLYGGNDQVIPKEPIELSRGRFSAPLHYAFYPQSYHMMLRDLKGERITAEIAQWILGSKETLVSQSR